MTRQSSVVNSTPLAALRMNRNLSREGLADKAGVSLRTIERIEAGDVIPHRATARALAAALGVDESQLNLGRAA